jgi:Gpi18-like mannosyltransferase
MKLTITKILILGLVLRIILAFMMWHPDMNNHVDWGIRFFEYGPQNFYAPQSNVWSYTWPNQPPGTILMFAGVRKIFEATFTGLMFVNTSIPAFPSGIITFFEGTLYQAMLKLPAILSDLAIAYLIYKIFVDLKKPALGKLGAIFFLFNPAIWYNSGIWGQTDSIVNMLCLAALYFLMKRNITLAALLLATSLYTKISLAIFVPLFIIIAIRQKYRLQDYVGAILLPIILFSTITILFSGSKNPIIWLYEIYTKKVLTNQLQVITANSFNIWTTIATINERPHSLPFMGLTFQLWGNILFAIAYIPLLVMLWKKQDWMRVAWVFSLTAFASWMLMTNMHERYLYPLFPFFTILAIEYKNLRWIYWTVSGLNLLNLYNFWFTPKIMPIVAVMEYKSRIITRVFGVVNFGLFLLLYYKFLAVKTQNRYN